MTYRKDGQAYLATRSRRFMIEKMNNAETSANHDLGIKSDNNLRASELIYSVIFFNLPNKENITKALIRHSAMRIPQLYINGILFHKAEGIELR